MHEGMKILVRSGGDLASAVIQKLHRCGFSVVVSELSQPKMVRRTVSFSNAIYEGEYQVEGIKAVHLTNMRELDQVLSRGHVPVVTDDEENLINVFQPNVFVDATLSKRSVDYDKHYSSMVIGLGPEIEAGVDAHVVIETCRGHDLGRLIFEGKAKANTSIPGFIDGFAKERVLRSPADGNIVSYKTIGDHVVKGDVILKVAGQPVISQIDGIIRGLIHPSVQVTKGLKLGDVDPRGSSDYCYTISDKGRNIAGAVLEAILILNRKE